MAFFASARAANRYVLTGRIVTMGKPNAVITGGRLCIEDDRIHAIVPPQGALPSAFASAPVVDTAGTIYPGLIELHNHLAYNYLPLWSVPKRYTNRNQWRTNEPDYDACVSLPARIIGSNKDPIYPRSVARYVECRSLLGGTTTSQGLSSTSSTGSSYYEGLIRNVEAPLDPSLPTAGGHTLDYSAAQIATDLAPALAKGLPFFYHLSEGSDADARQRYLDLEYHPGVWAITPALIAIHCAALQSGDFQRMAASGGMVWSPLSNLLLYGMTADIASATRAGVRIALGSDWSPSGSKNLLGELKIARIVSTHLGNLFTSEELVRMVTSEPARSLGWDGEVGTIEQGKKADLLIVEGSAHDPFDSLVGADESDLLAVIINGRPRYGRTGLIHFDPSHQEPVVVGGKSYSLDLTERGTDPLAGLTLAEATDTLRYGLAHLPDLAQDVLSPHAFAFEGAAGGGVSIDLELEEDQGFVGLQSRALAAAPIVRPLLLEPITAVDDPNHVTALRANPNLPNYVKQAL